MGRVQSFCSKRKCHGYGRGVIIGGAFGKIVTSLVNDILMPLIGLLLGGIDFTGLQVQIGDATIMYGVFIQTVVDF